MAIIAYLCTCKDCKVHHAYTYDPDAVEKAICPKCGKTPCGNVPEPETACKRD
jgi:hypothetical protein